MYLVWSVNTSGHFQGYARMTSEIRNEESKWTGPRTTMTLAQTFSVEWLNT